MSAKQRYCMGCMNPLPSGQDKCELCGYPVRGNNPPQYLPVGTVLGERYLVGRVLSVTGDAALYIGFDLTQNERIHIHEFFPDTLCARGAEHQVQVIDGKGELFARYLDEYRAFTRTIARMRDLPAISPMYDIFEANATVYTVTELTEGVSLETYLAQNGGRLSWDEARPMFMGLITTLSALHNAGILHLAISPTNLLVGYDKKLHLRGLCLPAVRNVGSDLKPHLVNGYAAPEQYIAQQECTVATDVYGFAATLFRTLTGQAIEPATYRMKQSSDLYVTADMAEEIPKHVLAALVAALQIAPTQRVTDMETMRDHLAATASVEALRIEEEIEEIEEEEDEDRPSRKPMWLIAGGVFLIGLIATFFILLALFPNMFTDSEGNPFFGNKPHMDNKTTTDNPTSTVTYEVEDLVGKSYYELREKNLKGYVKLKVVAQQYDDAARGTVLEQSPAPGTRVEKEAVIEIVISVGPEEIKLPSLAGWDQSMAVSYLEALGFRVQTMKVVESMYERGKVDSLEPSAGEYAKIGDVVILKISDADPTIQYPSYGPSDDDSGDELVE